MNTFQTLCALVLLVFVLSVIFQAVNEFIKKYLNTKAKEMEKTFDKFMSDNLPLFKAPILRAGIVFISSLNILYIFK